MLGVTGVTRSGDLVYQSRYERVLARTLAIASVVAFSVGLLEVTFAALERGSSATLLQIVLFVPIVVALFYGNAVYQATRLGRLRRRAQAVPLNPEHATPSPAVTILVPSYREEHRVVLQTLLSAALADYPAKQIVLLLDDPPAASKGQELPALKATRQTIAGLSDRFGAMARRIVEARNLTENHEIGPAAGRLASLYAEGAALIESLAAPFAGGSPSALGHADRVFMSEVALPIVRRLRDRACSYGETSAFEEVEEGYEDILQVFNVSFATFERKLFRNLSHAPNKAMNLNSYISLMGRSVAVVERGGAQELSDCGPDAAHLIVREPKYILTLDADSIILPQYIRTLVDKMERDERLAVAQTPYSCFPGAPNAIERAAGATTDIQYFVHQGFTQFNATFWVGANALLRLDALRDICSTAFERGHEVKVYIQDRTVIEDTGSTIDLVAKGWTLFNHPERLAYSATPSDFGALIIQRRRWANGGLIIFPDLCGCGAATSSMKAPELWIRAHYLLSPALASTGVLTLLLFPFDEVFWSPWLIASAVPYYVSYGRDLKEAGYRWRDLLNVYVLNLLLISVNFAGVLRSVQQMLTGRRSPFARTPKVAGRTASPATHIIVPALLLVTMGVSTAGKFVAGAGPTPPFSAPTQRCFSMAS